MFKKILLISLILVFVPLSAKAFFWSNWFKKPAPVATAPVAVSKLVSEPEKSVAESKYALWQKSFGRGDIKEVRANKNKFVFSLAELNYLLNSESDKAKKPLATGYELTIENNIVKVSADFKKVMPGKAYLELQPTIQDKKIRVNIVKARYKGIPIPASLFNDTLSKELDKYFSFLYGDKSYQGLTLKIENGSASLIPEFK